MTLRRSLLLTALIVMLLGVVAVPSQADLTYGPSSGWNGWWIYLSPSSQTSNDGCPNDGYIEGYQQLYVATTLAYGAGLDLVARGYRVQIGTGSLSSRVTNSNTRWTTAQPYMRHVALHSNAPASEDDWDCTPDYDPYASTTGTDVYHWSSSSNGHTLSYWINERVKVSSPGTGAGNELSVHGAYYELSSTSAPAVIVEEGYHTFKLDVDWLKTPATWGSSSGWAWRIGYGIDTALGYP